MISYKSYPIINLLLIITTILIGLLYPQQVSAETPYETCINACYSMPPNTPNPEIKACLDDCNHLYNGEFENMPEIIYIGGNTAANTNNDSETGFPLNVPIGGITYVDPAKDANVLGNYINAWYVFTIGIAGILATIMIMVAGVQWLISRGDAGKISEAKGRMIAAITGLALVFMAYTLLALVNPKLLTIEMPSLTQLKYSGDSNVDPSVVKRGTVSETQSSSINEWNNQTQQYVNKIKDMPGVSRVTTYANHDDDTNRSDMAVDVWCNPNDACDGVAEQIRNQASELNVSYVIWEQRIWNPRKDNEGWRPMKDRGSPTKNHMDHIHVSFKS